MRVFDSFNPISDKVQIYEKERKREIRGFSRKDLIMTMRKLVFLQLNEELFLMLKVLEIALLQS